MDDSWWDKVLPALAALAGVALTGGVEWLKTRSSRTHETKAVFRTKLESLTESVTETVVWTDCLLRATTKDELRARNVPIPPRRAYSLTLVYFPELRPAARNLLKESLAFSDFLIETFEQGHSGTVGAFVHRHAGAQFGQMASRFRVAREQIDDAIALYAENHMSR